jgi:hypothetical protein
VIIKFPFWQAVEQNPKAFYVCVNAGEAMCPADISERSLCMNGDISEVLHALRKSR